MAIEPPSGEAAELAKQRRGVLAQLLAEEGLDAPPPAVLGPRNGAGAAPLSFAQEVIWLLDRAAPGLTAYNSPVAMRVRGALDVSALVDAATALVARHESLRTAFELECEHAVQRPLPPAPVTLETGDFRSLPLERRETAAYEYLRRIADTPFDLAAGQPIRFALAQIADDEYLFLVLTHHIVSDAWSYGIIFRELSVLYDATLTGSAKTLAPMRLQFADYAAWQRTRMQAAELERRLAFWRERLAGLPVLELPTDRPAGTAAGFAGGRCALTLPQPLLADIQRLARTHGATTYAVLLAALQTVLHRYTGQTDVVVGSALAGRTVPATEEIVGYFSQVLPMRTRLDGDQSFETLLEHVSDGVLEVLEHQDVPFEALALELQRAGRPADAPLFRVVLTMQTPPAEYRLGAATLEPFDVEGSATKFDMTLLATECREAMELSLWYRTELFEGSTAERLLGHLRTVLESVVSDPGQSIGRVPLLTAAETAQLTGWNASASHADLLPVHEPVLAAARRTPAATAVVCGEERLRYDELAARTARVSARLRELGVGRGDAGGFWLDRSSAFVVGLLGTLRAGGAYVPLAPDLPLARLERQIAQSGVRVVVTQERFRARLPAGLTILTLEGELASEPFAADAEAPVGLDEVAYVLFTSGSTGVPKGVAVTHGNLAHYTAAISNRLELAQAGPLHFATVSSPAADLGNTAIFPALCSGGTLHLIGAEVAGDPVRFGACMSAAGIDVLKITPSHLRALLEGPAQAAVLPRRWLVLGGETLGWELAERVRATGSCRVLNHYGPTEATVGACTFEVRSSALRERTATVPIGRPLEDVRCYVLDERLQLVPVGVPGELCIGGAGVARGYVGQPELSAERFVADPVAGSGRMYRTGDRVRRLASGELEFLGRLDGQVKVRGFRVELGEIETALLRDPAVGQAAVVLRAPDGQDAELAAFVVAVPGQEIDLGQLRRMLGQELPEYMQPAGLTVLERFPLTANGKLDRAALCALGPEEREPAAFVAPRTPTEAAIAAIWTEVLNREQVSVTADFLSLGFHSILAIRALGKLSRSLGVRLPLRALFDAPTVEQLARVVEQTRSNEAPGRTAG